MVHMMIHTCIASGPSVDLQDRTTGAGTHIHTGCNPSGASRIHKDMARTRNCIDQHPRCTHARSRTNDTLHSRTGHDSIGTHWGSCVVHMVRSHTGARPSVILTNGAVVARHALALPLVVEIVGWWTSTCGRNSLWENSINAWWEIKLFTNCKWSN